jgi:hypothetical protein
MYGMSELLHLPARPGAPVACDMRTAADTPDQRLDAYAALFADALVRRERRDGVVALGFRFRAGVRDTVEALVRREAACCPFLDYRVERVGEEIVWTTTNPAPGDERAGVEAMLDAFYELPEAAGTTLDGFFERLAARGVEVIEAPESGWEFRRRPA